MTYATQPIWNLTVEHEKKAFLNNKICNVSITPNDEHMYIETISNIEDFLPKIRKNKMSSCSKFFFSTVNKIQAYTIFHEKHNTFFLYVKEILMFTYTYKGHKEKEVNHSM